ncbi:hypothetical protein E4U41_002255 [Claviceps citrina]|nr:hypothetical protein E4U41_002255 [Claviceps citrina]
MTPKSAAATELATTLFVTAGHDENGATASRAGIQLNSGGVSRMAHSLQSRRAEDRIEVVEGP